MICTSLQHKSFDEIVSLLESGKVEMADEDYDIADGFMSALGC